MRHLRNGRALFASLTRLTGKSPGHSAVSSIRKRSLLVSCRALSNPLPGAALPPVPPPSGVTLRQSYKWGNCCIVRYSMHEALFVWR